MRSQAISLLLIIMGSMFIIPVKATSVTITIQDGTIQATMVLSFHQNMTQLPSKTTMIDGGTDASLMATFTKTLGQSQPSPRISHLEVQVASNVNWINTTTSMALSEVTTIQGDVMNASTTWKAFHIDTDLQTEGLSYNTVGRRYLRSVYDYYVNASHFVGRPNSIITGVTFYSNQTSIGGPLAANQAGNLTLFDLRSLNATLDRWRYRYNLENDTSTWRYTPPPTMVSSIKYSRGLNRNFTIFANYWYDSEIIVSGLARSKGNYVLVDVGSGKRELIMTVLVIVSIAALIYVHLLYHRRRKRAVLGRR